MDGDPFHNLVYTPVELCKCVLNVVQGVCMCRSGLSGRVQFEECYPRPLVKALVDTLVVVTQRLIVKEVIELHICHVYRVPGRHKVSTKVGSVVLIRGLLSIKRVCKVGVGVRYVVSVNADIVGAGTYYI